MTNEITNEYENKINDITDIFLIYKKNIFSKYLINVNKFI